MELGACRVWEALRKDLSVSEGLVPTQSEVVEPLLKDAECVVAIGAGDSYAVALAAEGLGGGRVIAADPVDAMASGLLDRAAAKKCTLLALSVSGRTRAVVEAAKRFRSLGGEVVAVTSDPESPLAKVASKAVVTFHGGLACGVGAARHLLMLAATAGLFGEVVEQVPLLEVECPPRMFEAGVCTGVSDSLSSALFAALKAYEVFGSQVRFERLEQLVHAALYSVREHVVVFESPLAGSRLAEVVEALREVGAKVYTVPVAGAGWLNPIGQQFWVLKCLAEEAEKTSREKPVYVEHPGLQVLTRLVYLPETWGPC